MIVKAYLEAYTHISSILKIVSIKTKQIDTLIIEVSKKKYKQLKDNNIRKRAKITKDTLFSRVSFN